MIKKVNILAGIAIVALSGCTTIIQGTEDKINIKPTEDHKDIECFMPFQENESYKLSNNEFSIDRGPDSQVIRCESDEYEGETTIDSRFQVEWVAVDLLWDLCIITLSCPIDLMTGAFYDYPQNVVVEIEEKSISERATNQIK